MKNLLILFALIANLAVAQQTINASITHDGLQRDYILYVPANYTGSQPVPLLFNFHGYTSDANAQMWYGDFRSIADTAGFLIVHPQGKEDGSGNTHFNVWGTTSIDDLGFTSALIDSLLINYTIDEDRIYSTGMSNGGYMSFHLACNLSNRIAAIASVTGSMVPQTMASCAASHPTAIMQIHGTADPTVDYNGTAFVSESIQSVLNFWSGYNQTDVTPIITSVPNTSTTDGCTAVRYDYFNGDNCTEVVHYKVTNGGHTWPGSPITIGVTNQDFNASIEIWKFLSRYDINGLRSPCTMSIENKDESQFKVYPNPSNSIVTIEGNLDTQENYMIYSVLGEKLQEGILTNANRIIDLSSISSAVVYLKISGETIKLFKLN